MPACNQNLAKSKQKASLRGLRLQRHRQSLANRGVADSKGRSVQEALRGRQKKGRESWRGANCSKCCRFFGKTVTQCRRSLHECCSLCCVVFFLKACGIPLHGRSSGQLLLASPCGFTVVARKVGNVNIPVLNF